jgi:DMSO/TMAO reductase YedYZ molybdopterin-dependent catalytic subunit
VPRRLTNDLLLAILITLVLTGVVGWAYPVARVSGLYDVHRGLGAALVLVLLSKQAIVLPSLVRRLRRRTWDRSLVFSGLAVVGLLGALGLGLAWTLNLISFTFFWGYSALNVHVQLGIGLLPFVAVHAWQRRRQNAASAPVASRRTALRLGALGLATLVGWQAIERAATLLAASGARLQTGSKHAASFSGNEYPAEIWLFDRVPLIARDDWRLHVGGTALSYTELERLPRHTTSAVLDCTGGWWTEQAWTGWRMSDVLRLSGTTTAATEIAVQSVTGHRCAFPIADVGEAMLVTHVGGEVLSPAHGFPVRLAVPGRRGYQWVKWVDSITLS